MPQQNNEETEINLEADFDQIRDVFTRQARLQVDTILADLLPEEIIEPEYIKPIQAAVLRTFQGLLHSLNVVAQCAMKNDDVMALRSLLSYSATGVECKAATIERELAAAEVEETGSAVYRVGVMTQAEKLLAAGGLAVAYEYPGFLQVYCSGRHGNAQFGDSSDDGYAANWQDGSGIDFTLPFTATAEELAEAIRLWASNQWPI